MDRARAVPGRGTRVGRLRIRVRQRKVRRLRVLAIARVEPVGRGRVGSRDLTDCTRKTSQMAKSRCSCGRVLLWKSDEPASDEWWLVRMADIPDERADDFYMHGLSAAVCPTCEHVWVQHPDGLIEYVPITDAGPDRALD